jgi:hypothetical protein
MDERFMLGSSIASLRWFRRKGVRGPNHGTLTLDPAGARVTCTSASFLWHEMNARGQVRACNKLVGAGGRQQYMKSRPSPFPFGWWVC